MLIVKLCPKLMAQFLINTRQFLIASLFIFFGSTSLATQLASKNPSYFPSEGLEISFYKTTQSRFASGKVSSEKLKQNLLTETRILPGETKYYYNEKYYQQNELNPVTAQKLSTKNLDKPDLRDIGQFLIIVDTPLYLKPSIDSSKLTKLYSGMMVKPVNKPAERFQKGFVKVRTHGVEGFVNISHTISKFDFAVWIYPNPSVQKSNVKTSANNGWLQVKSRLFDEIETTDGQFINLGNIEGVWADETKGIIASTNEPFPLWTQVRVVTAAPVLWRSSRLPGHQIVWWKESDLHLRKTTEPDEISIDEILKKEIYSVSFHPKNPRKAIVSAGGVYITSDGQTWKKLKQFEQFSGPVHYFNDLMLFVGPYRSVDGGKTFENFIRIDELTQSITSVLGYPPQRLELRTIKTTSTLKIVMDVDIGTKKIKVQSPIYAQSWSVLRATTKN